MGHDHSSHAQNHSTPAVNGPSDTMTNLQADVTQSNQMVHLPFLHGGVIEIFLFPFLSTSDDASFAVACLVLVLAAFGLEMMRLAMWRMEEDYLFGVASTGAAFACRCKHCDATQTLISSSKVTTYNAIPSLKQEQQQHKQQEQQQQQQHTESHTAQNKKPSRFKRWVMLVGVGFMQTQVYQVATLNMLVAMTMNIYVIISLSVGSGIGKIVTVRLKQHYREKNEGGSEEQY